MLDAFDGMMLGIIQGLLEWLPVSSSGQGFLLLLNYFNLDAQKAFSIATILHFGTVFAVIVKYRKDVSEILSDVGKRNFTPLSKFLITASTASALCGGLIYVFFKKSLELFPGGYVGALVGALLIATGIILYMSRKKFGVKTVESLSLFDTLIVGAVQGFAALPGISRSGVTVSALLLSELKAEESLRLSFLLSIPAVGGMALVELLSEGVPDKPAIMLGILTAFIFGYASMEVLLNASRKIRFDLFCIIFGLMAVIASTLGFL